MSAAIKIGDVVKLKSGSQPMAVEWVADQGPFGASAYVVWMTGRAERMTAVIALEVLELAK